MLACLVRRTKTGVGGTVEVSLLESMLDLQFEPFSNYLNNGRKLPLRSKIGNAYVDLGAPYGIYRTKDGYIAISMGAVSELGKLIGEPRLAVYGGADVAMDKRDEIKSIVAEKLLSDTTSSWLSLLRGGNYWCGEIYNWQEMMESDFFTSLDMLIDIRRPGQQEPLWTTKCPIRVNGKSSGEGTYAPRVGADTQKINHEFSL